MLITRVGYTLCIVLSCRFSSLLVPCQFDIPLSRDAQGREKAVNVLAFNSGKVNSCLYVGRIMFAIRSRRDFYLRPDGSIVLFQGMPCSTAAIFGLSKTSRIA